MSLLASCKRARAKGLVIHERLADGSKVCLIPLTQGKYATIDEADLELVMLFSPWCAVKERGRWYVVTGVRIDGKRTTLKLHRLISNPPDSAQVDHWDGDGLNNRRCNLRQATGTQNHANQCLTARNTSGFKGVTWNRRGKKWQTQISVNDKHLYLGLFADRIEAAYAYDTAARLHFGAFAAVNFPLTTEQSTFRNSAGKPAEIPS